MAVTVLCHFHDEEVLLPYWLRHHRELFDHGVLVDRGSTDASAEIVRELVPDWELVPSRNPMFDARDADREMMDHERRLDGWKIVLNVTEQLLHDDLRSHLTAREREHPDVGAWGIRMVTMVDSAEECDRPLTIEPLYLQRSHGYFDEHWVRPFSRRFLHRYLDGAYAVGRHATRHPDSNDPDLLIARFEWSPYAAIRERKLRIQRAIPEADAREGLSYTHLFTPEELDLQYAIQTSWATDLRDVEPYATLLERLRARPPAAVAAPAGEPPGGVQAGGPARIALITNASPSGASDSADRIQRICAEMVGEHEVRTPDGPQDVADVVAWADVLLADPGAAAAFPALVASSRPLVLDVCGAQELPDALLARADHLLCEDEEARGRWGRRLAAIGRAPGDVGSLDSLDALRAFCRAPMRVPGPAAASETIRVSALAYAARYRHLRALIDDVGRLEAELEALRSRQPEA